MRLIAQRRQATRRFRYLREALDTVERHPQVRYPLVQGRSSEQPRRRACRTDREAGEAEKLLLAGYEGLRDLPSTPPTRLRAALERLVSFYAASGRSDEAASVAQPPAGARRVASAGKSRQTALEF